MIVKKHKTKDGRLVLSLCDSALIGNVFEDGKLQLNLQSDFYKGEELNDLKIEVLVESAYMIIFTGENAVNFGLKRNLVLKKNIRKICKVPYTQTIRGV